MDCNSILIVPISDLIKSYQVSTWSSMVQPHFWSVDYKAGGLYSPQFILQNFSTVILFADL